MIEAKVKKSNARFEPISRFIVEFDIEQEQFDEFNGKDFTGYTLILKKKRNKSRDMHNYMWALCDEIAKKKHGFLKMTKEDVYRLAVREVGLWNDIKIPNESTQELISDWHRNGVGWFAETVFRGESETTLRLYRGASVYDADNLYRLTNYVVDMAKEVGIETITDAEMNRLKEMW